MPTIGEKPLWKPGDPIRILVWGKSKVGKSFGAGSAPRPNFIDFDEGTLTLQGQDFVAKYGWRPDIRYMRFSIGRRDKRGIVMSPTAFDEACAYFDEEMAKHNDKFDTWVIDTGTTLSQVASDKGIYLLGGTYKGAKSDTLEQAQRHGLVIPKIQDYGAERSMVEQFIDMVKGSGKHVILLCHEYEETNDAGTIIGRGPLFTGKSKEVVPMKFDEVYRLTAEKRGTETKRVLQTKADTINKVGSRLGVPDGTEWDWEKLEKEMVTAYNNIQTKVVK